MLKQFEEFECLDIANIVPPQCHYQEKLYKRNHEMAIEHGLLRISIGKLVSGAQSKDDNPQYREARQYNIYKKTPDLMYKNYNFNIILSE
jgi:hypothetical protein